jgi:hypothetical protein
VNVISDTRDPGSALEDRLLIDRLVDLWKPHQKRGLEVRLETGRLLNQRLGLPTERLTYGQQILKTVAQKLDIAESDLNRMRWFSQTFESIEDLERKHPEVTTWTKVKDLLVKHPTKARGAKAKAADAPDGTKQPDEGGRNGVHTPNGTVDPTTVSGEVCAVVRDGKDHACAEHDDPAVVDDLLRSLGDVTARFRQNGFVLDADRREQMRKALAQLVEVVADRLRIRLTIETLDAA